ncbi:MAG: hypothetical protein JST49_14805 [Bacteroidetes bacterium]|nr:hypothetical protein [Bacteroidota bacterium]
MLFVVELQSCCLPSQNELQHIAKSFYDTEVTTINGRSAVINQISIVNIRKYTCDSLAAYVRLKGMYSQSDGTEGKDFDIARRLTIVKRGDEFQVVNEVIEE